jgi:hypothetical protein
MHVEVHGVPLGGYSVRYCREGRGVGDSEHVARCGRIIRWSACFKFPYSRLLEPYRGQTILSKRGRDQPLGRCRARGANHAPYSAPGTESSAAMSYGDQEAGQLQHRFRYDMPD